MRRRDEYDPNELESLKSALDELHELHDGEDYEQAQIEKQIGGLVPEELLPDANIDRRRDAAIGKAKFEAVIKGAVARTEYLPKEMIQGLAYGVADLMLVHLITGRVKPKSAKEAADVAKVMQDIARRESGEVDTTIVIRSPEERARALSELADLRATAQARAIEAGQAAADPDTIEDAVLVEDLEEGAKAGAIPATVKTGRALGTLRSS